MKWIFTTGSGKAGVRAALAETLASPRTPKNIRGKIAEVLVEAKRLDPRLRAALVTYATDPESDAYRVKPFAARALKGAPANAATRTLIERLLASPHESAREVTLDALVKMNYPSEEMAQVMLGALEHATGTWEGDRILKYLEAGDDASEETLLVLAEHGPKSPGRCSGR